MTLEMPLRRTPHWIRPGLAALSITLSFTLSGCISSILANKILRAPNLESSPLPIKHAAEMQLGLAHDFYSISTKVHVGADDTQLAVAILEPGDYKFRHELKITQVSPTEEHLSFDTHFSILDKTAPPVSPKGTLILLHGVMMSKESMLHWGFFLAQKGYRIVLVDLRGHGQSTGKIITYGARETSDLSQMLDELSRRNLIAGRVGVLGLSYGGAIAIQWAANEPRVAAIVALAPFSDAREAIDEFAHALMPEFVTHVSPETMSEAFALAAERGQFTWDQIDVLAATRRLRGPLLLIHGKRDDWIPLRHSEALRAAAPAGSILLTGPGDHLTLSLRLDPIAERATTWFDRELKPK